MRSSFSRYIAATAIALAIGSDDLARADDGAPECISPGSEAATGADPAAKGSTDFAGTVVNLSCDFVRPSGGSARCDTGEHVFALKLDGERTLYPLLFTDTHPRSDEVHPGRFTGKQVRVSGVRSLATGAILVSHIALVC